MILFGLFVSTLLWANLESPYVWIVLLVTAGFAVIGFYDDYLKVTKQSNKAFPGRARLGLAKWSSPSSPAIAMMGRLGTAQTTGLAVPFVNGFVVDFGCFFLLFGPFVIVSFGNAVNLTDGLDGLAIVPVMIAAATFGLIAYIAGNAIFSTIFGSIIVPFAGELMVVCGALIGAGFGFLWFNAPPRRSSWATPVRWRSAALLGTIAVAVKHEIVLAVIGGLFVIEAACRSSCRSFRSSSPASGCSAWRPFITISSSSAGRSRKIVMRFWIIAFVLAMVGLASLKLR